MHELDSCKKVLDMVISHCVGHQLSKGHKSVPISRADWPTKLDAEDEECFDARSEILSASFCISIDLSIGCLTHKFSKLKSGGVGDITVRDLQLQKLSTSHNIGVRSLR